MNKKNCYRKITSMFVVIAMLMSVIPSAFAAGSDTVENSEVGMPYNITVAPGSNLSTSLGFNWYTKESSDSGNALLQYKVVGDRAGEVSTEIALSTEDTRTGEGSGNSGGPGGGGPSGPDSGTSGDSTDENVNGMSGSGDDGVDGQADGDQTGSDNTADSDGDETDAQGASDVTGDEASRTEKSEDDETENSENEQEGKIETRAIDEVEFAASDGEIELLEAVSNSESVNTSETTEGTENEESSDTDEDGIGEDEETVTKLISHKVTLTGLTPGTTYSYRVCGFGANTWSDWYEISTVSGEDDMTFLYMSDAQIGAGKSIEADVLGWQTTLTKAAETVSDAAFIIHAGDQIDDYSANAEEYDGYLDPDELRTIVMATVTGNHEVERNAAEAAKDAFIRHFNIPNLTEGNASGLDGVDADILNYWFRAGSVLIVVLDNSGNASEAVAATFKEKIEEAKEANPDSEWLFVSFHKSLYSVASHTPKENDIEKWRNVMLPILEDEGVDVVLGGHDHIYVRTYPMKDDVATTTEGAETGGSITDPTGVIHLTSSSASGSKFYTALSGGNAVTAEEASAYAAIYETDNTKPSFVKVQVTDNSVTFTDYEVKNDTVEVFDSYTLTKTSAEKHTTNTISNSGSVSKYSIEVTENENGKITISNSSSTKGATVTLTVTPDEGYEMESLIVTDNKNNKLTLTDEGNGQYTFTMPASKVTVFATFKATEHDCPSKIFTDVDITQYYHEAVDWAILNHVTNGTSNTTFSPYASCTRAQMVTFLWHVAGSPTPAGITTPFTDLDSGAYYYEAVLWAVENGITRGTSATTFSPGDAVTRGQAVTLLYHYAGSPNVSGGVDFTDVQADAYYAEAVQWAVANEVTNGTSAATFSPESDCTRAQIVTLLHRYITE